MIVKIVPNAAPKGKLADVELVWTEGDLAGLKLAGFSVWTRLGGTGPLSVTFPARTYAINGERRSFALLRPTEDVAASTRLRDVILAAYADFVKADAA